MVPMVGVIKGFMVVHTRPEIPVSWESDSIQSRRGQIIERPARKKEGRQERKPYLELAYTSNVHKAPSFETLALSVMEPNP